MHVGKQYITVKGTWNHAWKILIPLHLAGWLAKF